MTCNGYVGCLRAIFGLDKPGADLSPLTKDHIYEVEEIILHPDYDPYVDEKFADVAVLKLSREVNSSIAKPISEKLSQALDPIEESDILYAMSAGWGQTEDAGVNYDFKKINVKVESCQGVLQNVSGLVCARDQTTSSTRASSCYVSINICKFCKQ